MKATWPHQCVEGEQVSTNESSTYHKLYTRWSTAYPDDLKKGGEFDHLQERVVLSYYSLEGGPVFAGADMAAEREATGGLVLNAPLERWFLLVQDTELLRLLAEFGKSELGVQPDEFCERLEQVGFVNDDDLSNDAWHMITEGEIPGN
jgi:hypothetical protein